MTTSIVMSAPCTRSTVSSDAADVGGRARRRRCLRRSSPPRRCRCRRRRCRRPRPTCTRPASARRRRGALRRRGTWSSCAFPPGLSATSPSRCLSRPSAGVVGAASTLAQVLDARPDVVDRALTRPAVRSRRGRCPARGRTTPRSRRARGGRSSSRPAHRRARAGRTSPCRTAAIRRSRRDEALVGEVERTSLAWTWATRPAASTANSAGS